MLRRRCLTGFCALAGLHMLPRAVQAEGMLSRASEGVQVPVYDVVVVGTGLAGHCAALSAKLAGAQRVMMIDKAPLVGGHSALASGSIAFVDEKRQAAQGIVDSVDKFVADARVTGGSIDEELVRFIAEKSGEGLDWLQTQGVRFSPNIFRAYGGMHPRCVTAFGNMGARRYIFQLHERSRELGIETRLMTRAVGLHRFEKDKLTLRLADEKTKSEYVIQSRAVVLATGGFGANLALRMRYNQNLDYEIATTANPHGFVQDTATGDGLYLAKELGAVWTNMPNIVLLSYWGGRMLDYIGAEIYVDNEGRRFVDETTTTARIAQAILKLPGHSMYVITDAKSAKGVNAGAKITAGSIRLSNSVAEMARGMNVPASELEHTLEEYNKHASEKSADAFGRTVYAQTIDKPPFYWGQERLMIHATLGGLKTDLHGRVKRKDGSVIEGLFAAGEVAGGIWGTDRLGGTGLLQCVVMGRAAGLEAAKLATAVL